mgnify:CR=1 FL=1
MVAVEFESPGGEWALPTTLISRTKLAPEDVVCPPGGHPSEFGNNKNYSSLFNAEIPLPGPSKDSQLQFL